MIRSNEQVICKRKDTNAHKSLIGNPKQINQLRIPRFRLHNIIKMGVSETECEFLSVGWILTDFFFKQRQSVMFHA
jgi:hypothetical protein